MPKAPSHYDPRRHPKEGARGRTSSFPDGGAEAHHARGEGRGGHGVPGRRAQAARGEARRPFAAYFVEEVRRELEDRLGDDFYAHKLRVHTTLDSTAQKAAEEELERQLRSIEGGALGAFSGPRYAANLQVADDGETPYLQGAVVALDATTGDVLAWVGGRDFLHSRFDRVKSARRQAGSAFKPFVYATAVASGRMLNQKVLDQPLEVSLGGRRSWKPKNFDGAFDGEITLRDALVRSKNVPTVRLAQDVGTHRIAEFAQQAGIDPPISEQPSMALGTVAVSPVGAGRGYTAFASRRGCPASLRAWTPRPPRVVAGGRAGGSTSSMPPSPTSSPTRCRTCSRAARTAVRESDSSARGRQDRHTSDGADTWFVGYTPRSWPRSGWA